MNIKKNNLVFIFLLISFFIVIQGPNILNNFKNEGKELKKIKAILIRDGSEFTFPPQENSVVLFWASWCAPCKLEMKRLQDSIENGNLQSKQVYAYNPFEKLNIVKSFVKEQDYDFQFFTSDPPLESLVEINATPTYLWIEKDKIFRMSTGISLIQLFWLEFFLKP
jgi:cytochrome c biogenesis protein CcmG, thiol:disulfide interchange protein DsbE